MREIEVARPLFDKQRALAFLRTEANLADALPLVLDSLRNDVRTIRDALHAGDVTKARNLLHELKGFVPMFCSDALIDRLNAVYYMSKAASTAEFSQAYLALMPLLVRLRQEMEDGG